MTTARSSSPASQADLFLPHRPPALLVYEQAFSNWITTRQTSGGLRRSTSAAVYEAMWSALAAWCVSESLSLDLLVAGDLRRYLSTRAGGDTAELSPRYAWRLLRLVERVAEHHRSKAGLAPFTASADVMATEPQIRYANDPTHDPLAPALSAHQAAQLVVFLSQARPRGTRAHTPVKWQDLRSRSSVALQLGAGLTPADVRALRIDGVIVVGGRDIGVPWQLYLPGSGNMPGRKTPIAAWAGRLLRHWLDVRRSLDMPGDMVFPSTGKGSPWSKVAQYEAARRVLDMAAMPDPEGGSYRLRHTFAMRQLRRGRTSAEVARWLGVADSEVQSRYGQPSRPS